MLLARLEVLGEVDARGAVRFDVRSPATLHIARKPHDVLVENFSRTGFLFVSRTAFAPGTLFAVGLGAGGSREAWVVWREGERHGCEFLMPLPQSTADRAFRGQPEVVAAIEAALRHGHARGLPAPPPAPGAVPAPRAVEAANESALPVETRDTILERLRRWFSRSPDRQ